MNRPQVIGIGERLLYTFLIWLGVKLVAAGVISPEMAAYLADASGAIMGAIVAFYGWWVNRPQNLMNAGTQALPKDTRLVIEVPQDAPSQDKKAAAQVAAASNDKVTVQVTT